MKKKLKTIRPTLRHKKRYVLLKLLTKPLSSDLKKTYHILCNGLQKNSGIFIQIDSNITILEIDTKQNTFLVRVNKEHLEDFLSSLFFSQADLGLIKVLEIKTTIKKMKVVKEKVVKNKN